MCASVAFSSFLTDLHSAIRGPAMPCGESVPQTAETTDFKAETALEQESLEDQPSSFLAIKVLPEMSPAII